MNAAKLQSRIVSIIRQDMANEATAGFPLLKRFPNSETLGIPEFFASIDMPDQEALLDKLAYYSSLPFSNERVNEKNSVSRKFLYKQPKYSEGNWYGERPRKSAIKKLLIDRLAKAGFDCKKTGSAIYCDGLVGNTRATLRIGLDPGLMRQLDYGLSDWMNHNLVNQLKPLSLTVPGHPILNPSGLSYDVPIIANLSYDFIWTGTQGDSGVSCWDLITETNLEQSIDLFSPILSRLGALVERINNLAMEEN